MTTEAAQSRTPIFIEGERAFPIYSVEARWVEDGEPSEYEKKDLPPGRRHNGVQFYHMAESELSSDDMDRYTRDWWEKRTRKGEHVTDLALGMKFVTNEVWVLGWFQHSTLDKGQTDERVLASFRRYVRRCEEHNDRLGGSHSSVYVPGTICLMGAEDEWRWSGRMDDGETLTDPPCRCKHCKAAGIIRIDH